MKEMLNRTGKCVGRSRKRWKSSEIKYTKQQYMDGHLHNRRIKSGHIHKCMDRHIHNRRIQVGTCTSIWTDTYATEGYKWAHTQVYGQTHTHKKDTSGHMHKYMDGHIRNRRIQVGTCTSIWMDTYATEGYKWAHAQVYGWTHMQQKDTSGHTHTSIRTDTYTREGYKWAHTQVYGRTHTQQKDTSGYIHKYMGEYIHGRRI